MMTKDPNTSQATPPWEGLDMGIWADDGTVWLPKALYPARTDAKKWAVENCGVMWIDVRCRTVWMVFDPEAEDEERPYVRVLPDVWTESEPFECWEI